MEEEIISQEGTAEMADTPLNCQSTACDHFMALESGGLAVCRKGCGHGCLVDPSEEIRDGKIVPRHNG